MSSCNYHLLAFGWAKDELSVQPKRGFGLMFCQQLNFTHCSVPGICSDALTLVRQDEFMGLFPLRKKLRAEPQPLFPGNVETSSKPLLLNHPNLRKSGATWGPRFQG